MRIVATCLFILGSTSGCAAPEPIRVPYPVEVIRYERVLPPTDLWRCGPVPEWPTGHLTWIDVAGQAKRLEIALQACIEGRDNLREWADGQGGQLPEGQ